MLHQPQVTGKGVAVDVQDMIVAGKCNAGQSGNLQGGDQLGRLALDYNVRSKSDMVEVFFVRSQVFHRGQLQHIAVGDRDQILNPRFTVGAGADNGRQLIVPQGAGQGFRSAGGVLVGKHNHWYADLGTVGNRNRSQGAALIGCVHHDAGIDKLGGDIIRRIHIPAGIVTQIEHH
ncbi:hypothetical protein D3C73_1186160 [compost metagenome]